MFSIFWQSCYKSLLTISELLGKTKNNVVVLITKYNGMLNISLEDRWCQCLELIVVDDIKYTCKRMKAPDRLNIIYLLISNCLPSVSVLYKTLNLRRDEMHRVPRSGM